MGKSASIASGDHIEAMKKEGLIKALEHGERSGFVKDIDRVEFMKGLRRRSKQFGAEGVRASEEKHKESFSGR
ncbi:MAG: hypothetical protein J5I62_14720 [Flavobacteriales bacterium]|nr:hypothetical protein [Flavobacteriales bacterium]MEB2342346.1 hypothetical protein [Flavobacteriia bacterium]